MSATVTPTGHRLVTNCGICDSERLERVLSLGSSPPPCVMHRARPLVEEHYPLELLRCADCTLVQLSVVVDPEVVFAADFPYSSGNSAALHKNFEDLARQADQYLDPGELVVDIGANDGTLLDKFSSCRKVAVEPTAQADRITGYTYRAFFSEALAQRILDEHGPAKIITACNVLAHVDDIADVMRGINLLLADDGVLIAENHDLRSVLAGQWDMVYHEHLRFYSPHSFSRLLRAHDLDVSWFQYTKTHGGSFRTFATRDRHLQVWPRDDEDFDALAGRAQRVRAEIRSACADGVWGIGATARGTTILNYCGLDVADVPCVCEVPQSDKIGHLIPGTAIPVVDEEILFSDDARPGLLLSWHMEDLIVPKLRARGYTKPILVPLPEPHWV
jgi:hypothetical protein